MVSNANLFPFVEANKPTIKQLLAQAEKGRLLHAFYVKESLNKGNEKLLGGAIAELLGETILMGAATDALGRIGESVALTVMGNAVHALSVLTTGIATGYQIWIKQTARTQHSVMHRYFLEREVLQLHYESQAQFEEKILASDLYRLLPGEVDVVARRLGKRPEQVVQWLEDAYWGIRLYYCPEGQTVRSAVGRAIAEDANHRRQWVVPSVHGWRTEETLPACWRGDLLNGASREQPSTVLAETTEREDPAVKDGSEHFDFRSRVGLGRAEGPSGVGCMVIDNPNLEDGERVVLVPPVEAWAVDAFQQSAPRATEGVVRGRIRPEDCLRSEQTTQHTGLRDGYRLDVAEERSGWNLVAVVSPLGSFTDVGGFVLGDVNGDGIQESFRVCTSYEGIHYTVWSGEPLTGTPRWRTVISHEHDPPILTSLTHPGG